MSSPYSNKSRRVMAGTDVPAVSEDGLRGGVRTASGVRESALPAFGSNGELNAGSNKELMQVMAKIASDAGSGAIKTASNMTAQERLARAEEVYSSYHDKSGEKWQVLGEVISDEIWETLGRQGISRKWFSVMNLNKGETARVRVRKKDILAWQVTSDVNIQESRIRQDYLYPAEYYLTAHIMIEDKEIEQASADILDEKFQDGLEAIMVREDNVHRDLMVQSASLFNSLVYFTTFTPAVLASMRTQVQRWQLPPVTLTIAVDIWEDIIADTDFVRWFDPVHRHELILEGRLGSLLGMEIITDGFRYDTLRVLQEGEVFVNASPMTLGTIAQRKALDAVAINKYNDGRPARGWFMQQLQASVLGNARAFCRGSRI